MKFTADGPDIPTDLIDASIRGEVVFLCGAGVSQPAGLPSFEKLTCSIFKHLGLNMDGAELSAFSQQRYEEAIGSLSRRVANRRAIYRAVEAELDADTAKDTAAHLTILRLSRDDEGKPAIVTTNFDTLFERAWHANGEVDIRDKSFASAQVPAPGGPRFEGIIHLHGRLQDKVFELEESDLVLTSADYGDAYLRSGWAARFLFDLARTRIIVIVGYSASDAPVRYILNILEADRERFPDLNPIYVLASSDGRDPVSVADEWGAVAVKPIIHSIDFPLFWRDMSAWAGLAELPAQWRKAKLEDLVTRHPDELLEWEKAQAKWVLAHPDALALLGKLNFPPAWVEFLRANNHLGTDGASSWSLCSWASRNLSVPDAFVEALKSIRTIRLPASEIIDRALEAKDGDAIPPHLVKAWHLLLAAARQPEQQRSWLWAGAFKRIKEKQATGDDLRKVVEIFTPKLSLEPQYSFYRQIDDKPRLSSICRVDFEPMDHPTLDDFLQQLPEGSPDIPMLLQLANAALIDALVLARDAGYATSDAIDALTLDIPSIAEHRQNEHYSGFMQIVRLCAELWLRLLSIKPMQARINAEVWKLSGFAITTRMWLFTLQNDPTISDNIAVEALLSLPLEHFWAHRKEVMELLRDRTQNASANIRSRLTDRIIAGPNVNGVVEDVEGYRDARRWPYLEAFGSHSALPSKAETALQRIKKRRKWQNRRLEEEDFFLVYSHGVQRGPIGDPAPVVQAPVEKRVEIASALAREDWLNQRDAWSVYCADDPEGALASLIATGDVLKHISRWRDLLWTIPNIGDQSDADRKRGGSLGAQVAAVVREELNELKAELLHPLVEMVAYATKVGATIPPDTWDWLWTETAKHEQKVKTPRQEKDAGYELISHAINAPSGKLARLIVNRLGPGWDELPAAEKEITTNRIERMLSSETDAGVLARAVIIEFVAWLNPALPRLFDKYVISILNGNDAHGFALRSLLVGITRGHTPDLRLKLREPILRGVKEFTGKGVAAENAAYRFLLVIADDHSRPIDDPTRLKPGVARAILAASSPEVKAGAAEGLCNWLASQQDAKAVWSQRLLPIFSSIWPAEKIARTKETSIPLAKFALVAGDAFPEVLELVSPYIVPLNEDWPSLHFASRKEVQATIKKFPRQTLIMLWLLLKPADQGQSHDLAKVLDWIASSDPRLVKDRRFQRLESRALRVT